MLWPALAGLGIVPLHRDLLSGQWGAKQGWKYGQQQWAWLGFCKSKDSPGLLHVLGSLCSEIQGCRKLWLSSSAPQGGERSTAEWLLYFLLFYQHLQLLLLTVSFTFYWLEWFYTPINFAGFINSFHAFFFFFKQPSYFDVPLDHWIWALSAVIWL